MWVWGEPVKVKSGVGGAGAGGVGGGEETETDVSVVYVDTEGFEATGMSDAYDDRIFALSSIVASVLIYNLPETVKEGDIEKLSFAVELARVGVHRRPSPSPSSFFCRRSMHPHS